MQSPALSDHDNTKDSLWMYNCEIDRAIAKSPFGLFSRLLWLGIPHRLYKPAPNPVPSYAPRQMSCAKEWSRTGFVQPLSAYYLWGR